MARRKKGTVDPATLEKYLPKGELLTKCVGMSINRHNMTIKAEREAHRAATVTDAQWTAMITAAEKQLADIRTMREAEQADPLSKQAAELKKQINKAVNCLTRKKEIERPCFSKQSEALIFVILHIVSREIERFASTDQPRFMRIVTGEERTFWLTSNKTSLSIATNRWKLDGTIVYGSVEDRRNSKDLQNLTSGMKGKKGLFASLLDSGFLVEKVDEATCFRLCINLDWLFAYSFQKVSETPETQSDADAAPTETPVFEPNLTPQTPVLMAVLAPQNPIDFDTRGGNSTRLVLKEELHSNSSVKKDNNQNGAAEPQDDSALRAKKITVEGKTSENPLQNQEKNGKSFAPREIFSPEKTGNVSDVPFKLSENLVFSALKHLFNREMMNAGRVKSGEHAAPVTEIRASDFADMGQLAIGLMVHARIDGEQWTTTHERLTTGILDTAKYYAEHPARYIYPPKMWLNLTLKSASLRYYHDTFLLPKAQNAAVSDETTPPTTPSVSKGYSPQLAWFMEQGADPRRVHNFNQKFTKFGFNGQEIITDMIRYCGAFQVVQRAIVPNWKPENGMVAYVFGALGKLTAEKAALMHQRAELMVAKAKGIAPAADVAAAQWTAEVVMKLAQRILEHKHQKNRVTFDVCERISAHVITRRIDSEAQITAWLCAIGEGRPTLFNKNEPPVEAGSSTQG